MVTTITPKSNPKTTSSQSQSQSQSQTQPRPPLLPSERGNGLPTRKPKSKEITSRYLQSSSTSTSSSSSRRCPSPLPSSTPLRTSSTTPLQGPKRSQSVDRRRPITPLPTATAPPLVSSKPLFTSTRSLSVSFQGESFSLPVSKTKTPDVSNVRKITPERRRPSTPLRGKVEGAKPVPTPKQIDQHCWPRRINSLTKSVDFGSEKKNFVGSVNVSRALQQSMADFSRRASLDGRLNPNSESVASSDQIGSDTDSVSSGSNSSSTQEHGGIPRGRSGIPAKFGLETNSRMRRMQEPSSMMLSSSPKGFLSRKPSLDSPGSSPRNVPLSRTISSPLRGHCRPASPSKLMVSTTSSPSRGMASPCRGMPSPSRGMPSPSRGMPSPSRGMPSPPRSRSAVVGVVNSHLSDAPCILSTVSEVRRGKLGDNQIVNAHFLRLLYNRHLQWRLVNARADAALLVQRLAAEKTLYNAWVAKSELQHSVTIKRIKLQLLRQNSKLTSILKGQITYLEEWAILERDYSSSLSKAAEALEACTLRLPVVSGARADLQTMKDAIGSAVDVMQALASSLCSLPSKVEEVNSLLAELKSATSQERALLVQCRDLLSRLAAMQVKDCSLRTHILQVKHVATSLTMQVYD